MNPVDFVRRLGGRSSRQSHDKDARVVRLVAGPLAKAFPGINPKAVWALWDSRKDETGFRHEIAHGEVEGLPAWVRIDDHAGLHLTDLLVKPLKCKPIEQMLQAEDSNEPAAIVFHVLNRGDWIVHNLALDRVPETVRVDVAGPKGQRVIVMSLKDFIKERVNKVWRNEGHE